MILISTISYNIGRITALKKTPLNISGEANIFQATSTQSGPAGIDSTPAATPKPTDLRVIASKKSTSKKYHYLWCAGGKKIKEENKIWFNSAREAETAGYTLAGNCEL